MQTQHVKGWCCMSTHFTSGPETIRKSGTMGAWRRAFFQNTFSLEISLSLLTLPLIMSPFLTQIDLKWELDIFTYYLFFPFSFFSVFTALRHKICTDFSWLLLWDLHRIYRKPILIFHMQRGSDGQHTTVWSEDDQHGFTLLLGAS